MIPKGMIEPGEAPAEAALREFEEETGTQLTAVPFPLATVRQAGGKIVEAFAVEGDLDPAAFVSNEFEVEWPPRSGRARALSRSRRGALDDALHEARAMMLPSQLAADRRAGSKIERMSDAPVACRSRRSRLPRHPAGVAGPVPASKVDGRPAKRDVVLKDFRFRRGETLPELRMHYTTLGRAASQRRRRKSTMR